MKHHDEVSGLLGRIESEIGKVQYVVSTLPTGVADVQIIVYPVKLKAQSQIFNLHDGLTPLVERRIRDWFEPLAHGELA
jgi:hypothetical protein